jgi:membrane-bound lytic murein transglycosylase F
VILNANGELRQCRPPVRALGCSGLPLAAPPAGLQRQSLPSRYTAVSRVIIWKVRKLLKMLRSLASALVCTVTLSAIVGCSDDDVAALAPVMTEAAPVAVIEAQPEDEPAVVEPEIEQPPEVYVDDLDGLVARGKLRILIPANVGGAFYLPRAGWPVQAQEELAERFALSQGLEPELVPIAQFGELIPALLTGKGDVIAANLTVTDSRRQHMAFSVPLTTVRQQVIVAAGDDGIEDAKDLAGKRVMSVPGSSFWERLEKLRETHPDIELVPRPPEMSDEEVIDAVAAGKVDATVRDSNIASMYLSYRDDVEVAFQLPHVDDIAWGVRPDAHRLRAALNKFLHLEQLLGPEAQLATDDFDKIRERRLLRVLLPNNAASYFLHRGELQGFEYELAKAFADAHRLRLEVIVPKSHDQKIDWLLQGQADLAAGFLEPSDNIRARGVAFSRPYHYAPRHLVVDADSSVTSIEDLNGMSVHVRRSSTYWDDLQALLDDGADLRIIEAPEDAETEELIAKVAAGEIEATVADGHLLDIELARGLGVKSGLLLSEERPHAVAVRATNPQLLTELDAFIKKEYRGLVYNILYKKYFTNSRNVRDLAAGRPGAEQGQGLSPYDEAIRRYAEQYGFDWRLITAQMYQESRFDPDAKSFAGAKGLMQVMPRTARFMGFKELKQPEDNIHAGVKYLDWVRNRFEETLPFADRMWFSLAAYNAGHGHVADARRLALQKGWNGDVWFDNTEKAMLLLSKKKYASKARYGYVRGIEPVSYVRNIRTRYRAYSELSERRLSTEPEASDLLSLRIGDSEPTMSSPSAMLQSISIGLPR